MDPEDREHAFLVLASGKAKLNWQSDERRSAAAPTRSTAASLAAKVIRKIENQWKGEDKHFTITLEPQRASA